MTETSPSQQAQTKKYFGQHALDWQRHASGVGYTVIENRHRAVHEIIRAHPVATDFLDVGCGTGQLAIEVAGQGIRATGTDFAPEMIAQCEENNRRADTHATFRTESIFDTPIPAEAYDVISAQGFIEYISLAQLSQFFDMVRGGLRTGGVFALGSRNRLFNLHALNSFTTLEQALGTTEHLLTEAIILQSAGSQAEAVEALGRLEFIYPQPTHHPTTGIAVDTRYQFSPADLIKRLKAHGLETTRILPVHFHALPVSRINSPNLQGVHETIATLVSEQRITDHALVPYSSSFVIEAKAV